MRPFATSFEWHGGVLQSGNSLGRHDSISHEIRGTGRQQPDVLDDYDSMRQAIVLLLRSVGYHPLMFPRPADFLAKYDPEQHGCVVSDIRMPQMSGLEKMGARSVAQLVKMQLTLTARNRQIEKASL